MIQENEFIARLGDEDAVELRKRIEAAVPAYPITEMKKKNGELILYSPFAHIALGDYYTRCVSGNKTYAEMFVGDIEEAKGEYLLERFPEFAKEHEKEEEKVK